MFSDLCSQEQVSLIMRTWKKEGPFCLNATARIPHPGPSVRSQRLILQGLQSNFVFVLWCCFHFKGFASESRESFLEPSGVSMVTSWSGPEGSQHSLHFATSSSFLLFPLPFSIETRAEALAFLFFKQITKWKLPKLLFYFIKKPFCVNRYSSFYLALSRP